MKNKKWRKSRIWFFMELCTPLYMLFLYLMPMKKPEDAKSEQEMLREIKKKLDET